MSFAFVEFLFRCAGFDDAVTEIFNPVLANGFVDVKIVVQVLIHALWQRLNRFADIPLAVDLIPDEINDPVDFHKYQSAFQ